MPVLRFRPLLVAGLAAGTLAACSKTTSPPTAGASASASPAVTATATLPVSLPVTPASPTPVSVPASTTPPPAARPAVGALTTIAAAEAYAQTQAQEGVPFAFIGTDATWRPGAILHVLHAKPSTAASSGGDYYFFFVNGNPAGRQGFSLARSQQGIDAATFQVTYLIYKPGDAQCCPTGGQASVRFHWDGSKVTALDPLTGPTQS